MTKVNRAYIAEVTIRCDRTMGIRFDTYKEKKMRTHEISFKPNSQIGLLVRALENELCKVVIDL